MNKVRVTIVVSGGVAVVARCPEDVKVEIIDYDNLKESIFDIPEQHLPSELLNEISTGDNVKLRAADEAFWVKVEEVYEDVIRGIVDNRLICTDTHGLSLGDNVEFLKSNVFEVKKQEDDARSKGGKP